MLDALLVSLMISGAPVLAAQEDPTSNRVWVLKRSGVEVHDRKTGKTLAQVALPGWQWADEMFACAPALALGPKGEAIVSSNVLTTLWRVDPSSLAVSRHEPVLDVDQGKDIDFTGIAYVAEQGAYFAISQFHGSLWRIDSQLKRAQRIPLSEQLRRVCGLEMQKKGRFVRLCVRGTDSAWTINLAPDQRSGYVHARPCE